MRHPQVSIQSKLCCGQRWCSLSGAVTVTPLAAPPLGSDGALALLTADAVVVFCPGRLARAPEPQRRALMGRAGALGRTIRVASALWV